MVPTQQVTLTLYSKTGGITASLIVTQCRIFLKKQKMPTENIVRLSFYLIIRLILAVTPLKKETTCCISKKKMTINEII
ncbi:hypothetical protein ACGVWS_15800 [Enterobacteriaceae bacterium LUAb1]